MRNEPVLRALIPVWALTLTCLIAGCDEGDEASPEEPTEESAGEASPEGEGEESAETAEEATEDEAAPDEENLQLDVADMQGGLEEPAETSAPDERHIAHILIRYRGAERAPPEISRSREQAEQLAGEIAERVNAEDFAEVAGEVSEDLATKEHGGDLGTVTRGLLPEALDRAAFALEVGAVSEVVETELGFHVVKRLE